MRGSKCVYIKSHHLVVYSQHLRASKVGGVNNLLPKQSKTLSSQQIFEFRKRYGQKLGKDRRAELVTCQNGKTGQVMGCVGIEVENLVPPNSDSILSPAPFMSNLAVSKEFRRRGIAEDLVIAAEKIARKEWGYEECFLFVEKKNKPAIKLYKKLGYRKEWEDDTANTLTPLANGTIKNELTVVLCMKKNLNGGFLRRLLPFWSWASTFAIKDIVL